MFYQHVSSHLQPYHVTSDGYVFGYGKKILAEKNTRFTVCKALDKYILIGDNKGRLLIYDKKYLISNITFHHHEGPILAIKVLNDSVFYTGSDSKITCLKFVDNNWCFVHNIRGQSHDIFSLQLFDNDYLLSGGLTTDVCFYRLSENNIF